jgi:hypothetical protein
LHQEPNLAVGKKPQIRPKRSRHAAPRRQRKQDGRILVVTDYERLRRLRRSAGKNADWNDPGLETVRCLLSRQGVVVLDP